MRLIRSLQDLNHFHFSAGTVVTIGNYDGLHLGHQRILSQLVEVGRKLKLPKVVIIFEPQPEEYFNPFGAPQRLMGLGAKLAHFKTFDIDFVLCLKFGANLALRTAEDFCCEVLAKNLKAREVIVGEDFRFGRQRIGSSDGLITLGNKLNFRSQIVPLYRLQNEKISSTNIRMALRNGNVEKAATFLGRPYRLSGRVVHGDKIGRKLGFPTANLSSRSKVVPLAGVYFVKVAGLAERPYSGVANIAIDSARLEVYLLHFNCDIYGKKLDIDFLAKLRDEKKFPDFNQLKTQIAEDIKAAERFFNIYDS